MYGLGETEEKQLISLMGKVQDKMSIGVFEAVAEKFVITAVETVVMRRAGARLETLLIPRPEGDIHWPGLLHTPGSILRRSDYDNGGYVATFKRIEEKEVGAKFAYPPRFVGYHFEMNKRGGCNHMVFIAEIEAGAQHQGEFYDVDDLPANFLDEQVKLIKLARNKFLLN